MDGTELFHGGADAARRWQRIQDWPALLGRVAGFGLGAALLCGLLVTGCAGHDDETRIGSKKFTESVVLGELATGLVAAAGTSATHRRELGGTRILWEALKRGDIDVYPEYTGTLRQELLDGHRDSSLEKLRDTLLSQGLVMGAPLGFNNAYAIGMKEDQASRLGITRVSDLARHPTLVFGFTAEFMDRSDGWPGLADRYGLADADARGLDHDLAYRALSAGRIDVTDVYVTDADIEHYGLRVLEDDRGYFPAYQALFLYRQAWVESHADAHRAVERLAGQIDAAAMRSLNADAKIRRLPEQAVAAAHLARRFGIVASTTGASWIGDLVRRTGQHLFLVATSMVAAVLVAVPLGVASVQWPRLGRVVLAIVALLQTIPSLALLVLMIPLLGIGAPPALAALFVYSLLPIVANTHAGLRGIAPSLIDAARVLGLSPSARLRLVELPLATPSILAGIKTSVVINVGTATLGALIGAGGYGQPILTGIRLDDFGLILQGAVPAAGLAIVAQLVFDAIERWWTPRGLRRGLAP